MRGDVYTLMKSTVCHERNCKHDGDCDKCEFGDIRRQAASDDATITALRGALVGIGEAVRTILFDYDNGKDFGSK